MKADDERQYVEFVTSRLPWICKVAFLLCQDWHHADDICQAAITRLYIHWRRASAAGLGPRPAPAEPAPCATGHTYAAELAAARSTATSDSIKTCGATS